MKIHLLRTIWLTALLGAASAHAHHSAQAAFTTNVIQVEGYVTAFNCTNPHVNSCFEVSDESGEITQWVAAGLAATLIRRQGWTADSIIVGPRLSRRQRSSFKAGAKGVVMFAGPSGPPARRAHLTEFGTGPRISPITGKSSGQVAAQPFMRPAWQANKRRVLKILGNELWVELRKAARRLSRQSAKFAKRFG